MEVNFELIVGISGVLALWIANAGGIVALTGKLKSWLGVSGLWARVLSMVVTAVLGVILAIASGELTQVTIQDIPAFAQFLYTLVFAGSAGLAAQWAYKASK